MNKPYAYSTLLYMTKRELIEIIRCAEHNEEAYRLTLDQQIKNTTGWEPIVRCKDCVHFVEEHSLCAKLSSGGDDFHCDPYFYCAYGEMCERNPAMQTNLLDTCKRLSQIKDPNEGLKPCPFCGGRAFIRYDAGWKVYCEDVDCLLWTYAARGFKTAEEAKESWNRRS